MKSGPELFSAESLRDLNRRLGPHLDPKGEVMPGQRPGGRVAIIAGLEGKVSLLQVAQKSLGRIQSWLKEIEDFLAQTPKGEGSLAPSVANRFIEDRLRQIQGITEATSFGAKALLNGRSGVSGEADGKGLQWVRGSARTISSQGRGYPVAIDESARPASLMGAVSASPAVIAQERMIALKERGIEARYFPKGDEQPRELAANLQACIEEAGLDLSVYLTRDQRLLFLHNQLGGGQGFEGLSQKTRLLSPKAGQPVWATPGRDIAGTIGTEPAQGQGGFLIGAKGNPRTEGLVVYYDGQVDYPGQVVGYVRVTQSGLIVPLDLAGQEVEILSLPDLRPGSQAVGVRNPSGFRSLGQIKAGSLKERHDAKQLVKRSLGDLSRLAEELRWKEEVYVTKTIDLLRQGPEPGPKGEELLELSAPKAQAMAEQLKGMMKTA